MHWNDLSRNNIYELSLKNSINRWKIMTSCMLIVFVVIILRVFDLSLTDIEVVNLTQERNIKQRYIVSRANIVDRSGILLASNIKTASIYAHPKQLINASDAARNLASCNIGLSEAALLKKLTSNKDFVWIKRHVTPAEQQAVHDLGMPGIYFLKDERRVYPHDNLFSHVLGYANIDGIGMAGIERLYNDELIHLAQTRQDMKLSLDVTAQSILHNELSNAIKLHSAIGGAGVIMDANNGEIIAMASLPDFNPHNLSNARQDQLFNQVALGAYEMGSTFKPFTIAIGLDSNRIKINDAFDVSRPLKIGRFSINDYRGKGGYLSVPEILMYSSNLGVAQIARLIGAKTQREYLEKFGLLSEINSKIPETGKPMFPNQRKWSDASLVTISYGHGIAVTGIHLAQAMVALVNGGRAYQPSLLKYHDDADIPFKRVIKEKTSVAMRKLLRLSVENGSAKKADVVGMLVGGKTGTAEKNKHGRYSKKLNLALFIGAFPMNKPKYVVLVMLDEAKANAVNSGYTTGGMIAAPVGGNIINRLSQVFGIMQQDYDDKDVVQSMYVDYTPRYETKLAKR